MPSLFREFTDNDPEFSDLKHQNEERYVKYGLKKNPFPLGGNFPEGYLPYTFLSPSQEQQIRDFLISTFFRSEFNGMVILGEYGTGKSHLLNYIHETVNVDEEGVFAGRSLAFLIQNPSVAPEDILIALLRTIQLETLQDLIFLPVRQELSIKYKGQYTQFLLDFTSSTGQLNALEKQNYNPPSFTELLNKGYREFRAMLREQNISLKPKEIRQFSRDVLVAKNVSDNPIIIDSLVELIFANESRDTRSWESFLMKNLVGKNSRIVGVEYYLGAILELFKIMGIQHIYLLVDELEDLRTQRLSRKAATEYLATLRRMIQANYRHFSFVLASARDAWNELKLYYPAIEDRFPVEIDLVRNPDEIKSIIRNYLNEVRVDNQEVSEWFPFTEDALDTLIDLKSITLRHVITECRKLIDDGINQEIEPPLDSDFVEQTYNRF